MHRSPAADVGSRALAGRMPSRITRSRRRPDHPSGECAPRLCGGRCGRNCWSLSNPKRNTPIAQPALTCRRLDEDEVNTAALAGNLSMRPHRPPLRPDIHAPTPW